MKSNLIALISALSLTPFCYTYANEGNNNIENSWEGPVKVNLNLYAFAASANGEIQKGNIHYDVDQPFKDSLDYLDETYMLHLDVSKGRWGAFYDTKMAKFGTEANTPYTPVVANAKLNQHSLGVYYQAYVSEKNPNNHYPRFIVEPMVGVHHTDLKAQLGAFNQQVQTTADWNEVFWGSRFKYNFDSPWNLSAEVSLGAEDTLATQAYLGYRKEIFKRPINFRVGYRYFEQDHHHDDFKWHVSQHGPVLGINLPLF